MLHPQTSILYKRDIIDDPPTNLHMVLKCMQNTTILKFGEQWIFFFAERWSSCMQFLYMYNEDAEPSNRQHIQHGMNACLEQTTLVSCRASKTDSLRKKILFDQNTYFWCKLIESFHGQSETAKLEQN